MAEVIKYIFPLGLGVIMLGLGLSLTVADFRRVVTQPRAVIAALTCQVLLMPWVCLGIAHAFGLSPELAIGMVLLAATPGGTVANLYSHMARGDVALNITLTAVNSVLCMFTLPIIVNLSLIHFLGEGRAVPLKFSEIAQVFAIVLGPVSFGMFLHWQWPAFAARCAKPVKVFSSIFLVFMIVLVAIKSRGPLLTHGATVGGAVVAFSAVSLFSGYLAGRVVRVRESQAIAMGMEIGIHNAALAITIAIAPQLLGNPVMAISPTVYGMLMLVTAGLFGWLVNLRRRPDEVAAPVATT